MEFFPNEIKAWTKNNVLINTIRVGATQTKLHSKLPSKISKRGQKSYLWAGWLPRKKLLNSYISWDQVKIPI